jgi:protease I
MADGKLAGKNVLMAIPHTQFRDEEFFEPKKILEAEGATVTVASTAVRMCYGTQGGSVQSTVTIADSKAESYDALVICGGPSVPDLFWNDKKLAELAAAVSAA